ncbi:transglutaminase family protein [Palleronia sediminis]|uniref:Transglutaminase family protein n=2 Tax=Palleronia sediminis TaxID=2547833 RepID=A0A4R6AQM2_9RHOB|nr:transglutaminase family protein [Palleronia sediminis]
MKMRIEVELDYDAEGVVDVLMQIETAWMVDQTVTEERLDPGRTAHAIRIEGEDSIGSRVWLRPEGRFRCVYSANVEIARPAIDIATLPTDPVWRLPAEAVPYLMASRYCPSDEFQSFVAAEFGDIEAGACIARMADWIAKRYTYSPGASGPWTTALDTFVQRRGICRDFAHVLISLARAKGIPARMVSGYCPEVRPQDFHALAQVWLDGAWHLVDPTGMATPDRLAIIGVGRDAADIAFLTSYGWLTLRQQNVAVHEIA